MQIEMYISMEITFFLVNGAIHKCLAVAALIRKDPFNNASDSGGIINT